MNESDFDHQLVFRSHNLSLGYFYEVRGHSLYVYRSRADSLGSPVFVSPVNIFSAFHSSDEQYLVVNHGSGAWGHVPVVFRNVQSTFQTYLSENEYRDLVKTALKLEYKDYAAEKAEIIHLRAPIREIVDGKAIIYARGEFYRPVSEGGFGQKTFEGVYLSLDLESKSIQFLNKSSGLRSWYRGHPALEASYGSGVFVTPHIILTNQHVVQDADWVVVALGNREASGKVIARSTQFDLAAIEVAENSLNCMPVKLANSIKLGLNVKVFGYPLPFHQGYTLKVTQGIVSGLFGLNDDPLQFQISAPIQPGNSGGAIMDDEGHLIGMVVSSLNKSEIAKQTGSLPENVNFGIHIDVIRRFIELHKFKLGSNETYAPFDPEYTCVQVEISPR